MSRMGALLSFVFALFSFPFLNPLMSVRSPCLCFGAFCTFGGLKSVGGGGGAGTDMLFLANRLCDLLVVKPAIEQQE